MRQLRTTEQRLRLGPGRYLRSCGRRRHTDPYTDSNRYGNANSNRHRHSDCNRDPYSYVNAQTYAYREATAYSQASSNSGAETLIPT